MARGWESKSVEAQQEQKSGSFIAEKARLTPQEADQLREKQGVVLSLKRIVDQLENSRSAHHREVLQRAKLDLEEKLVQLNSRKVAPPDQLVR